MRGHDRLRRFHDGIRKRFGKGSIILLYHRITTLRSDPQMLSVTPAHFAEHLDFLRQNAHPISLRSIVRQQDNTQCVAVTFDDGYADNLHEAKPILERFQVPATVFVAAGYVGVDQEFWWDELEQIILENPNIPDKITIEIEGRSYSWTCQGDSRRDAYEGLSAIVKRLSLAERERVLTYLRSWANQPKKCRDTYRPLNIAELRELQQGALVEIGSHTLSHPVLSTLDRTAQCEQIAKGKSSLEAWLGTPIKSFAYPFGKRADYNKHSVSNVRSAGIDVACSNFEGLVWPITDPLELPRMLVRDWDGEEFGRRYKAWTS